jgi:DNA polymerase-3 subunit gamma/tau
MLVQNSDDIEDVLDISAENMEMLKKDAAMVEPAVVLRYIRIFSELANRVKFAVQKRVLIEVALIKLCRPQMESDYESLVDRVGGLEKKLEKGIVVSGGGAGGQTKPGNADPGMHADRAKLPDAIPDDIRQVMKDWNVITLSLSGVARIYIKKALKSLGPDGSLLLVFDDNMEAEYIADNKSNCLDELKQSIADHIGKNVNVQIQVNNSGRPGNEIYPDLKELVHFDIEEEDF